MEFGSLAQLVDRVDEVKGRAGDSLREHLADVLRNRQLTELARDVPVGAAPRELRPAPWDREQIHQLFDTLQFRVLRERLQDDLPERDHGGVAVGTDAARRRGGGFDVEAEVLGSEEVAAVAGRARQRRGRTGLAASGSWGRGTGVLRRPGAGRTRRRHTPTSTRPTLTEDDERALAAWLADPAAAQGAARRQGADATRWPRAAWSSAA